MKSCGLNRSCLRSVSVFAHDIAIQYNCYWPTGSDKILSPLTSLACPDTTEVTLDPNTANKYISLIEENRKRTWVDEEQTYPDDPQRFEEMPQVLCREPLTKRHYGEADLIGNCDIGVAYKCISRWGKATDCKLGAMDRSWCMFFEENNRYLARHNKKENHILYPTTRPDPQRVGVYLDWPDGTLSFYSVSSDTMTHLYTFQATFTEPLYPAFGVLHNSSVSLVVTSSPVPAVNPI